MGKITIAVWGAVLASVVIHAAWAHHSVASSSSSYSAPKPTVHRRMLISEGRDAILAAAGLLAAVVAVRSGRQTPAVVMTVVAALAFLLWGASFVTALRHTDRTFFALRPWSSTHFVLLWHAFLEPGLRWLFAGVGFAFGIMAITRLKREPDAEP